jgi:hypothetical protein
MPSRFASAVHGVPYWALLGAILGAVANVGDEGSFDWGTVGMWAGCGTAFGLGADALWPTENWRDLPVEAALGARLSF